MLERPKAYSIDNLRKKKCPCKCLLKREGKIWTFLKILHRFWSFQHNFQASDCLINLYACNSRLEIRKSVTEKLFLCVLKINFKTVKKFSTCLLGSVAASWGVGSKFLFPTKIFKTIKTSSWNSLKLLN